MNREILFHGKRVDNGEWVEGYLYRISEKLNPFIMLLNRSGESYEVIPETVGQYTGMTDKNGKKIFEGDILKGHISEYAAYPNRIGKVQCSEFGGWIIEFNVPEWKIPRVGFCSFVDYEVIGNIHDNPELLEAAE